MGSRDVSDVLAANIAVLIERAKRDQKLTSLAKSFTPKTLNNLAKKRHKPTLKTLQCVAEAFHLEPWQLLVPGFHVEMLLDPQVPKLVRAYADADDNGRAAISAVVAISSKRPAVK